MKLAPSQHQNPAKVTLVREHFLAGNSLTSLEAFHEFGVTRLAAVVYKLAAEGWQFEKEWELYIDPGSGHVTRWVRYSLDLEWLASISPRGESPLRQQRGSRRGFTLHTKKSSH